ncbi:MAG: hypothetical protein P8Z49_07730, partial [Acidobacteriota bacterium]
ARPIDAVTLVESGSLQFPNPWERACEGLPAYFSAAVGRQPPAGAPSSEAQAKAATPTPAVP